MKPDWTLCSHYRRDKKKGNYRSAELLIKITLESSLEPSAKGIFLWHALRAHTSTTCKKVRWTKKKEEREIIIHYLFHGDY